MRVHKEIQAVIKKIDTKELANGKIYLGCFPQDYFIKSLKVTTTQSSNADVAAKIIDEKGADVICDIDLVTLNTIKELSVYNFNDELKDLYLVLSKGKPTKGEAIVYYEMIAPSKALVEFA